MIDKRDCPPTIQAPSPHPKDEKTFRSVWLSLKQFTVNLYITWPTARPFLNAFATVVASAWASWFIWILCNKKTQGHMLLGILVLIPVLAFYAYVLRSGNWVEEQLRLLCDNIREQCALSDETNAQLEVSVRTFFRMTEHLDKIVLAKADEIAKQTIALDADRQVMMDEIPAGKMRDRLTALLKALHDVVSASDQGRQHVKVMLFFPVFDDQGMASHLTAGAFYPSHARPDTKYVESNSPVFLPGRGIAGAVWREGAGRYTNNNDPDFVKIGDGAGVQSLACIPIIDSGTSDAFDDDAPRRDSNVRNDVVAVLCVSSDHKNTLKDEYRWRDVIEAFGYRVLMELRHSAWQKAFAKWYTRKNQEGGHNVLPLSPSGSN